MSRALVAALICAALAGPTLAATYKWTDASGRVVYSDIPPQGDVKYERVGVAAPPPASTKAVQDMAAKEVEMKKRQADAAEKDKKADEKRIEANKRAEMCQRAESNIRNLAAEQIPMMRYNQKGEAFYLDEATRRRERADIESWVKENCGVAAARAN